VKARTPIPTRPAQQTTTVFHSASRSSISMEVPMLTSSIATPVALSVGRSVESTAIVAGIAPDQKRPIATKHPNTIDETKPLVLRERNSPITNANAITAKHIIGVQVIINFLSINRIQKIKIKSLFLKDYDRSSA
jgi:hypothetical protein